MATRHDGGSPSRKTTTVPGRPRSQNLEETRQGGECGSAFGLRPPDDQQPPCRLTLFVVPHHPPTYAQIHTPRQPIDGAPGRAQVPLHRLQSLFSSSFRGYPAAAPSYRGVSSGGLRGPRRGVSQRQLSRTHRIGSATVERWYQSFVRQRVSELSGRTCPRCWVSMNTFSAVRRAMPPRWSI